MRRASLAAMLLAAGLGAFAQSSEIAKPDAAVERRLKALADELRCLVCQNQTIADSNAPLAVDLRNQLRSQIAAGRSDGDIRAYMVERYGDFVLYRPPLRATTLILWVGPFVLVGVGALIFLLVVRRRRPPPDETLSAGERGALSALLEGEAVTAPEGTAAAPRGESVTKATRKARGQAK